MRKCVLLFAMLLASLHAMAALQIHEKDGLKYEYEPGSGSCSVKECDKQKEGALVLDEVIRIDGEDYTLEGIKASAFGRCEKLERISIPRGVKTIAPHAFYRCVALREVTLPDGLETLGAEAFLECPLERIVLPAGLKTIGGGTFRGCAQLKEVTLPAGLETLGGDVFSDCVELESISIPAGVKRIGSGRGHMGGNVFSGCVKLKEVSLPEGLEVIGEGSFRGCAIERLVIPPNVKIIGRDAFAGCEKLRELTLPEGLVTIGGYAFGGCPELKKVDLPASVVLLGGSEFAKSKIERYIVPPGVEVLSQSAFNDYSELTRLVLNREIKSLPGNFVQNCPKLETLTLPVGLETVKHGFYLTNGVMLKSLFSPAVTPPRIVDWPAGQTNNGEIAPTTKIYVPKGSVDAYKVTWSDWKDQIVGFGLSLTSPKDRIAVGEELVLAATVEPATFGLEWESSDAAVATVDATGKLVGRADGVCMVTARIAGSEVEERVRITVGGGVPVERVELSKESAIVILGEQLQLSARVVPAEASNKELTWFTSGTVGEQYEMNAVAGVNASGLVSPLQIGNATVTARTKEGKEAVCRSCTTSASR